ncbi:MAG: hypothetical protein JXB46_03905 [Candidatus Eisenbacteria bacterium]|nr:hypothetical protein [Candidatus Eisenbacteria bacterium]
MSDQTRDTSSLSEVLRSSLWTLVELAVGGAFMATLVSALVLHVPGRQPDRAGSMVDNATENSLHDT